MPTMRPVREFTRTLKTSPCRPAEVRERASLTLNRADTSKSAFKQDFPAFSTTDAVVHAVAVTMPISLGIPVPVVLEAETVIPFAPPLMLIVVKPPVGPCLPLALDIVVVVAPILTFTDIWAFLDGALAPKFFIGCPIFIVTPLNPLTPGRIVLPGLVRFLDLWIGAALGTGAAAVLRAGQSA